MMMTPPTTRWGFGCLGSRWHGTSVGFFCWMRPLFEHGRRDLSSHPLFHPSWPSHFSFLVWLGDWVKGLPVINGDNRG
jgi:hypothetical protein